MPYKDYNERVYENAIHTLKVADLKLQRKSCGDCLSLHKQGFIHYCITKQKQVKPYNICHLHQDKISFKERA